MQCKVCTKISQVNHAREKGKRNKAVEWYCVLSVYCYRRDHCYW